MTDVAKGIHQHETYANLALGIFVTSDDTPVSINRFAFTPMSWLMRSILSQHKA